MADENVLEEFLVNVLYNVDERKRKDFNEGLVESYTKAKLVGDALETMAAKGVAAIERYVNGMERLYYVSRNTGASVQNLQALGFAMGQLGGNAQDAVEAVSSLIQKMKETPGTEIFINNQLGIPTRGRDPTAIVMDVVKRLAQMPAYQRLRMEPMVGLTEQQFMTLNNPDVERQMNRFKARQDQMGINPQKAAADAAEFMRAYRDIGSVIDNIGSLVMSRIVGGAAPELTRFSDYLAQHGPEIADVIVKILNAVALLITKFVEFLPYLDKMAEEFGGWDKVILAVGAALLLLTSRLGLLAAMALPGWLLTLLGVGVGSAGLGAAFNSGGESALKGRVDRGDIDEVQAENIRNMSLSQKLGRVWQRVTGQERDVVPGRAGKLSSNQKEAYAAARAEGLDDKAAKAIVANLSGEGLSVPQNVHWDGSHFAHGIAQWDDVRSARIKQQFGKMPQEMSVAEQTKAHIWELKKFYPQVWKVLQESGNSGAMIHALVHDYELPADKVGQTEARKRIFAGLGDLGADGKAGDPGPTGVSGTVKQTEAVSSYVPKHDGSAGSVPVPPVQVPSGTMVDGKFIPAVPTGRADTSSTGAGKIPSWAGGLNTKAFSGPSKASALGIHPIGGSSSSTTTVAPTVNNTFHIDGAASPAETAAKIHEKTSDVHADLVRNMRNSVG